MDQTVSRGLIFTQTDESLVVTTHREARPAGGTGDIVEEVTVLSATTEAEVPPAARGGSSGSKRRKMQEKIGEDKTEKVIRIEDIEAETPSKDQASAQEKTELHVSGSVKPDGTSSVAREAQRDLEEAGATLAPATEEPPVEDDAPQNLNSSSCDSHIAVENVASEIRECQQEITAALAGSEEKSQVGLRVSPQEASLSTRATTSEKIVSVKSGRANVRTVTTPTHRSTRHSKQEDVGLALRGRTIRNTLKHPRHSPEESEREPAAAEREAPEEEETSIEQMEEPPQVEQRRTGEALATEEPTVHEGTIEKAKGNTEERPVSEMGTHGEADIPVEDAAEGNLPPAEVEEAGQLEEEEAPLVGKRAVRHTRKTSTATARRKSARGGKQWDEEESQNGEEEPAATTRTLRRGGAAATHTAKGRSERTRKQIQGSKCVEATGGVEEEAAEEPDEEMEEVGHTLTGVASDEEEGLHLEKHVEAEAEHKQQAVGDETGPGSDAPAEGDEVKAPEEDIVEVENEDVDKGEEKENTATVIAAPEETTKPSPSAATHSAVLPAGKDGATPSAEETENQLPSLRKLTVVLVDLQKPNHGAQDVTQAEEESLLVQKDAAKAEGEPREKPMEDKDPVEQVNVPVGIRTTEKEEGEPVTNQEEGERRDGRDPSEGDKHIEAEEAVNPHDDQGEGPIDEEEKTSLVAEEAVAERDGVQEEQSTSTCEVVERAQQMLTAKDEQVEDASEEEAPVVERVLRSGRKTAKGKTTTKHADEQGEKRAGEGEPAADVGVLRKGRKPADGARTPCRGEREEDDGSALLDKETKALLEESDRKEECTGEKIEGEDGNEEGGNAESLTEQETVEEKPSAAEGQAEASFGERAEETPKTDEAKAPDEAARATTRKGRRSAAAPPGRNAKRTRTQCQQEEGGGGEETLGEEVEAGQESPEETVKDQDVETKDASTGEAGVLEEDDRSVEAVTGGFNVPPPSAKVKKTSAEDEETTAAEPRQQQKASPVTQSPRSRRQKDDAQRRSVRKRPKVNYRENEEGERHEEGTDEEEEVTVASDGDHGNEAAQCPSGTEAAGASKEGEEYELNTSEEEEPPIVIGERVLRGRSLPSVTMTPQSRSRRRIAKVSKEKSPRSAHKRKGPEVTRQSKRLSRV
nr:spore wall protein 2 isoform X2 [Gasterosteus aculeatus aculeatus]